MFQRAAIERSVWNRRKSLTPQSPPAHRTFRTLAQKTEGFFLTLTRPVVKNVKSREHEEPAPQGLGTRLTPYEALMKYQLTIQKQEATDRRMEFEFDSWLETKHKMRRLMSKDSK
ncbi:unnamed protein product [Nesidiocoris tenuis]|uniref:Uncharacterized protein n=1 Tax=Nesidiocoris tenuis TaxID=355587 RepID=A0A6H5HU28_9HEMI|nr:unnamed protein product [Nesidiocoris tenuis]